MRLGIYGGTFDPVHYGHLLLAECCREQARLDEVWFMPAATPPHKQAQAVAAADDRVAMLELAIGGHEAFRVSRLEVDRGGVSFTVETLARVAALSPAAELFFLLGADALRDLPTWREPARICQLATLLLVGRPGQAEVDFHGLTPLLSAETIERIRAAQVQMPHLDLSASDLRARVARGQSIRYRTPRAVEKYIETRGLYRAPDGEK